MRILLALSLLLLSSLPAAHAQAEPPPTSVETRTLSSLSRGLPRTAPAEVRARHEAELAAELAATLIEIRADTGDTLKAGAVLARLDDRDARLALDQARAQRDAAKARLSLAEVRAERGQRLGAQQFISGDELKALLTEVEIARAELALAGVAVRQAQRMIEKTEIRAPYPLVVRRRLAQVGQQLAPGQTLFSVVAADAPELTARLEASLLDGFRGAALVFHVSDQRLPLELLQISPVLSPATRSHEVRLRFREAAAPIGAEGRLEWVDTRSLLPAEFLSRRGERLGVFVLDVAGDRARFHALPDAEDGRPARVTLPPETPVITRGRQSLQDGDAVRVVMPGQPVASTDR